MAGRVSTCPAGELITIEGRNWGVADPGEEPTFGLLVKDVTFNATGSTSAFGEFEWVEYDDYSYDGSLPAQQWTPVVQAFQNHMIVRYNGVYYDPSYGVTFDTPREWENAALSGTYYYDWGTDKKYGRPNDSSNPARITNFMVYVPFWFE